MSATVPAVDVIGAGGIGCALAFALARSGATVRLVERCPAKLALGRRDGVQVVGLGSAPVEFVGFDDWQPAADRIALICTKTYDNPSVVERLTGGVPVVPVQNGYDPVIESIGPSAEGVASFVSECLPGRPVTRLTRRGELHLGPRDGATPGWLADLAGRLTLPGRRIRVRVVPDVRPYKNTKLMYNAAISPLAAASGFDNGQLLSDRSARTIFFALLQENYAILTRAREPLGRVGPFAPATVSAILRRRWLANCLSAAFYPGLRGRYCSMSGDLPRGRTELEHYTGHLLRLAGDGRCPWNRRIYRLVREMEQTGRPPGRWVFEPLLAGEQ